MPHRPPDLDTLLAAERSTAGPRSAAAPAPRLASTPLLSALLRAGTRHVYADTADAHELDSVARIGADALREEIDGNTANQPLVRKVVERGLEQDVLRRWDEALRAAGTTGPPAGRAPWLYTLLCARIGRDLVRAFGAGRRWEISLQLHMGLAGDPAGAVRAGELLAALVPGVLVKVPFAPDAPHCLLVARELERRGIPVNLTSTFSARQVAAAALLAEVRRTNVFLGRLEQGLSAERLGEHVVLEAQRALRVLRREDGLGTELIAASLRDWRSIPRLAGCDAFTVPCKVLRAWLEQREVPAAAVADQRETSLAGEVRVPEEVERALGSAGWARLHTLEPELVELMRACRESLSKAPETDVSVAAGEELAIRFAVAGFGDLFHLPTAAERRELPESKLPRLDGALIGRVAIDTHYSLLANADFAAHQAAIDAEVERALAAPGARSPSRAAGPR